MTHSRAALPTLTEVIDIGVDPALGAAASEPLAPQPESLPLDGDAAATASMPRPEQNEALIDRLVETLQPRIDALLEVRLRANLAPALSRLVEDAVHGARGELDVALRELVTRAVAEVLSRRRGP